MQVTKKHLSAAAIAAEDASIAGRDHGRKFNEATDGRFDRQLRLKNDRWTLWCVTCCDGDVNKDNKDQDTL